jgi:hypothetical protein
VLYDAINPQSRAKIYAGPKKNTEQNIIAEINNPLFTQLGGGGARLRKTFPIGFWKNMRTDRTLEKVKPFRYELKMFNSFRSVRVENVQLVWLGRSSLAKKVQSAKMIGCN